MQYLTHYAVETKFRVVYSDTLKFIKVSINDMLNCGSIFLELLVGKSAQLRQHVYAIIADIKNVFFN